MRTPRSLLLMLAVSMAWTLACAGPVALEAQEMGGLIRRGVDNSKNSSSVSSVTTGNDIDNADSDTEDPDSTFSTISATSTSSSDDQSDADSDSAMEANSSPDEDSSASSTAQPSSSSNSFASWFQPSFRFFPVVIVVVALLVLFVILVLIGIAKQIAHLPRFADPKDSLGEPLVYNFPTTSTSTLGEKESYEEPRKIDEENRSGSNGTHGRMDRASRLAFRASLAVVPENEYSPPRRPRHAFVAPPAMRTRQQAPLPNRPSSGEFGQRDVGPPRVQNFAIPRATAQGPTRRPTFHPTGPSPPYQKNPQPKPPAPVPLAFPTSRIPYDQSSSSRNARHSSRPPRQTVSGSQLNLTDLPSLRPRPDHGRSERVPSGHRSRSHEVVEVAKTSTFGGTGRGAY
ncbi:hypothetical protein P7C70_g4385, partial [Phenoliferia sp. Uapishka_3]